MVIIKVDGAHTHITTAKNIAVFLSTTKFTAMVDTIFYLVRSTKGIGAAA